MTTSAFLPPVWQPLPEPLRGNEAGTFAADTVARRLPEIARRTAEENDLTPRRSRLVEALAAEIGAETLSPIDEPEAADQELWARYVAPYLTTTWFDAPWFLVETYFFRRLLAATGYSQPGSRRGVDPFLQQKRLASDGAMDLAHQLGESPDHFPPLLAASLWANRVDLSLWPASDKNTVDSRKALTSSGNDRLLVDDTAAALDALRRARSIHIVLDNAGPELVADLALSAAAVDRGASVTLHAKPHPTYVSDATGGDVMAAIRRLETMQSSATPTAASLLSGLRRGLLRITSDAFWVSPEPLWECPPELVAQLGSADLIIVKGDANYRRMLGDLHWPATTPVDEIVRPPSDLLALRTAKSEVAAGLTRETIATAQQTDPAWMTNGRWGVVQLVPAVA